MAKCPCGRPLITRSGDLTQTCAECRSSADSCACEPIVRPSRARAGGRGSIGTKKEERTKSAGPDVPAVDPSMYAGILGEITLAAAPTTEADPVGIYTSLLAGAGVFIGPGPYV